MEKFFRLLPILMVIAVAVAWLYPLAALGTKIGLWHFRTAFSLIGGAALSSAILLALSGVAILMAIARKNDKAKHRAALIALILIVPLGFVFFFGVKAGQVPRIHDISTDQTNPPLFDQLLAQRPADANPLDYTADVAAAQREAYPNVQPLVLGVSVSDTLQRAEQVARDLGWEVVNVDPASGLLEATDTSFWFGFVDDIVVRLKVDGNNTRVDIRSVSRVGQSDIGKNAARIEAFLAAMQGN